MAADAAVERAPIVVEVGAVGGADLAQPGTAPGHDVGDAERAADLDQLAARDQRRRARRRARSSASTSAPAALFTTSASSAPVTLAKQRAAVVAAAAAGAGGEIELEVAVAARDRRHRARRAAGASGARPRLVCSTTPVALSTGRRPGALAVGEALADLRRPVLGRPGAPGARGVERLPHRARRPPPAARRRSSSLHRRARAGGGPPRAARAGGRSRRLLRAVRRLSESGGRESAPLEASRGLRAFGVAAAGLGRS